MLKRYISWLIDMGKECGCQFPRFEEYRANNATPQLLWERFEEDLDAAEDPACMFEKCILNHFIALIDQEFNQFMKTKLKEAVETCNLQLMNEFESKLQSIANRKFN